MIDNKKTTFVFEKGVFSPSPLVSVIGGLGQMGGLFAALFEKSGCHVSIIDRPNFFEKKEDKRRGENAGRGRREQSGGREQSERRGGNEGREEKSALYLNQSIETITQSDIVILAASLSQMDKVIKQYVPHISKGALLLDIASVKQAFLEQMIDYADKGVEIVGAHPLFGPYPKIEGQRIVLCPVENAAGNPAENPAENADENATGNAGVKNFRWFDLIKDFFSYHGLFQVISDGKTHDENVALTQSLLHAILFSLVAVVNEKKKTMEQVLEFTTPLFKIQSDLAARLLSQKGSLYADIAFKNSYTLDAMKSFREVFSGFIDCLEQKDSKAYQTMIEKLKTTFVSLEEASENSKKWVENPSFVNCQKDGQKIDKR